MDEYSCIDCHTHYDDNLEEEEEYEKLYAPPIEIVALLSLFYGGISLVSVVGNSLVIWVVATTRQMRTITNLYIANLAFADVIIGLFCVPFQFQAALLQRWNLPWFMCGFCPFVQALSVNVSVFTLTAIAVDRHRAIINPLRARPSKCFSKSIILAIWLAALLCAIPCAIAFRVELIQERYREDNIIVNVTRPFCLNQNLSDEQLQTYRYLLVFVQYLVPFCVIGFVYIQMAVRLWGTRAPGNAQDSRDLTLLKNKKKVIKMLIIVVIVFGLCWLPLQLYNILYVTIPEINEYHFISIVWFCCDWLAMSNSCYNPFIYGIYNEKFKREFNKRFATCFCKFKTSLDATHERTMSMHTRGSSIRSHTLYHSTVRGSASTTGTTYILDSNFALKRESYPNQNDSQDKLQRMDSFQLKALRASNGTAMMTQWGARRQFRPANPDVAECDDSSAALHDKLETPCDQHSMFNATKSGCKQHYALSQLQPQCICLKPNCNGSCLSEFKLLELGRNSEKSAISYD